jgi:hypothetical protein
MTIMAIIAILPRVDTVFVVLKFTLVILFGYKFLRG